MGEREPTQSRRGRNLRAGGGRGGAMMEEELRERWRSSQLEGGRDRNRGEGEWLRGSRRDRAGAGTRRTKIREEGGAEREGGA